MNSSNPKVTVLMPVYNAAPYLAEAIDSILGQTFTDFEFLIINDGSTDNSKEIISSYTDARIRYIENEQNLKLTATLNKGLALAEGKYIARMDADDISLPERLEKQVAFMDTHTEIGLCGCFVKVYGSNRTVQFPASHDEIAMRLFFTNCLAHPTIMLRKNILDSHNLKYPDILHAEDYAMWVSMAQITRLAVLPEALLVYRVHDSNISQTHKKWQQKVSAGIRLVQLQELLGTINEDSCALYENFLFGIWPENLQDTIKLIGLFKNLLLANEEKKRMPQKVFYNTFAGFITDLYLNNSHFGLPLYAHYKKTSQITGLKIPFFTAIKFYMRCILKNHVNFTPKRTVELS